MSHRSTNIEQYRTLTNSGNKSNILGSQFKMHKQILAALTLKLTFNKMISFACEVGIKSSTIRANKIYSGILFNSSRVPKKKMETSASQHTKTNLTIFKFLSQALLFFHWIFYLLLWD